MLQGIKRIANLRRDLQSFISAFKSILRKGNFDSLGVADQRDPVAAANAADLRPIRCRATTCETTLPGVLPLATGCCGSLPGGIAAVLSSYLGQLGQKYEPQRPVGRYSPAVVLFGLDRQSADCAPDRSAVADRTWAVPAFLWKSLGMDWTQLADAVVGGVLGGGITAGVAWQQLRADRRRNREDRQYQDAEVVAEAWQLLIDVDPERRGINMSADPAAEYEQWVALRERMNQVGKQLLWLAAGRPSADVRTAAGHLSSALNRAVVASEWHVRDMQAHRDPDPTLSRAQEAHAEAVALSEQLEKAIGQEGAARSRLWSVTRRQLQVEPVSADRDGPRGH